jgi:hypothetical protein
VWIVNDPSPERGTVMANKDKGGRSTKKVAAKDLKQKRQSKKEKKAAAESANRVIR